MVRERYLYIHFKVAVLSSVKQILMYSNVIERNKSNLPQLRSGYQIGILLAVAMFTFFLSLTPRNLFPSFLAAFLIPTIA